MLIYHTHIIQTNGHFYKTFHINNTNIQHTSHSITTTTKQFLLLSMPSADDLVRSVKFFWFFLFVANVSVLRKSFSSFHTLVLIHSSTHLSSCNFIDTS